MVILLVFWGTVPVIVMGSRLVFHNYDIEGIIPDKTVEVISNEDNSSHTLYLYTIPLKKEE